MKKLEILMMMLGAFLLSGCSSNSEDNNPNPINEPIQGIELTETQKSYVNQSNDFAFRLAEKIVNGSEDNCLVSPISVGYVLGMLHNGADGETKNQIAATLGFANGNDAAVNDYFKRMLVGAPYMDNDVKINIANAIMVNNSFPLKSDYAKTVRDNYQASVENYDFSNTNMVAKVNDWASQHTNGMINKVIDKVTPSACMYALNAVYFQGKWTTQFNKGRTTYDDFKSESGQVSMVQMMHLHKELTSAECDDCTLVQLPYGKGGWAMHLILPAEGKTISDVMALLNKEEWRKNLEASATEHEVDLALPQFEIESSMELNNVMKELGMPLAFDIYNADFSRLSNIGSYLSRLLQKAKIKVDESGTEAAAVTVGEIALTMSDSPSPRHIIKFHANRPFIYLITENSTGAVYFIGVKKK